MVELLQLFQSISVFGWEFRLMLLSVRVFEGTLQFPLSVGSFVCVGVNACSLGLLCSIQGPLRVMPSSHADRLTVTESSRPFPGTLRLEICAVCVCLVFIKIYELSGLYHCFSASTLSSSIALDQC